MYHVLPVGLLAHLRRAYTNGNCLDTTTHQAKLSLWIKTISTLTEAQLPCLQPLGPKSHPLGASSIGSLKEGNVLLRTTQGTIYNVLWLLNKEQRHVEVYYRLHPNFPTLRRAVYFGVSNISILFLVLPTSIVALYLKSQALTQHKRHNSPRHSTRGDSITNKLQTSTS